jgi:hypothetical protein
VPQLLGLAKRVDEHQSLATGMKGFDNERCVFYTADVVERQFREPACAARSMTALSRFRTSLDAVQDLFRIADRRRPPNSVHVASGEAREPLEQRRQMRAAIVVGE